MASLFSDNSLKWRTILAVSFIVVCFYLSRDIAEIAFVGLMVLSLIGKDRSDFMLDESSDTPRDPYSYSRFLNNSFLDTAKRLIPALLTGVAAWYFDAPWLFSILILFFLLPSSLEGAIYFVEPIFRKQNPFLFWAIIGLWILWAVLA